MPVTVERAAESGNGVVLEVGLEGDAFRVVFLSEARTGPQPLWFHMEAKGLGGRPVTFVWQNADGCLGKAADLERIRTVARAPGGEWMRLDPLEVEERAGGRRLPRFRWQGGADEVAVAFCYPYGPRQLEETLGETSTFWEREVIGVSGHGRPYERLRLASGGACPTRPGAYVVARNHAGETPGSWAIDGIIRFLASGEPDARRLREAVDWWILPFVDLDGVVEGDYGKDAAPFDFNRAWLDLPMRPEVLSAQRDMRCFKSLTTRRLVMDLHGPGHAEDGVYVFMPREGRPVAQRESVLAFVECLAARLPEVPREKLSRECRYASRYNTVGTTTGWAWHRLKVAAGVTLETSYQTIGGAVAGIEDYRRLGRQYALAAGDLLCP